MRARIRSIDLYPGHADGNELVDWIVARIPNLRGAFLVHGEETAIAALSDRLAPVLDGIQAIAPVLDQCFELTGKGAVPVGGLAAPRLPAERIANLDWRKMATQLYLDIGDVMAALPDEKSRGILIRKLQRPLNNEAEDNNKSVGKRRS